MEQNGIKQWNKWKLNKTKYRLEQLFENTIKLVMGAAMQLGQPSAACPAQTGSWPGDRPASLSPAR